MITDLIKMLETHVHTLPKDNAQAMLLTWCVAARSGFTIRHNIAHGVPGRMGDTLTFMRNPRWAGEVRKREFGDFWADESTLDLMRGAFATLLRVMRHVERGEQSLQDCQTRCAESAGRSAFDTR